MVTMTDVAPARHGAAGVRIADGLRRAILSGEYEPGARIRQDDLADLHGASRLPVREALRMLEGEGLVIEPLLLRYNVPLLSEQQIDELERLATMMEGATDLEDFIALDREFHLSSYALAETTVLGDTVMRLWNRTQHYRRAFMRVFRTEGDRSVHLEHHLLVSAIRRRDLDESERVLAGHIRRTRLELARHPEVFSA
jgi:DNA-binding GntR family transcriptional regulator